MHTPPSSAAARASRRDSGTPTTLGGRTTGVTNEQLQKKLQKKNDHIQRLIEENRALEAALVERTVEDAISLREADAQRLAQLMEAQDAVKRLQSQMHALRETEQQARDEAAAETQLQLQQQAVQLQGEAGEAAERAVELLRTEYEERLFRATQLAERTSIELRDARREVGEKDAVIASMKTELLERRNAMNRLHAACSRSCTVSAASAFASSLPDAMLARLSRAPLPTGTADGGERGGGSSGGAGGQTDHAGTAASAPQTPAPPQTAVPPAAPQTAVPPAPAAQAAAPPMMTPGARAPPATVSSADDTANADGGALLRGDRACCAMVGGFAAGGGAGGDHGPRTDIRPRPAAGGAGATDVTRAADDVGADGTPLPSTGLELAPCTSSSSLPPRTSSAGGTEGDVAAAAAGGGGGGGGADAGGSGGGGVGSRAAAAHASAVLGAGEETALALHGRASRAHAASACVKAGAAPARGAPSSAASASAAMEAERVARDAQADLDRRVALAKAEKALQHAALREERRAAEHLQEVAAYEEALRCAAVRETCLVRELPPLEAELLTQSGVYGLLQRTLAQLADAERAATAARSEVDARAAAERALRGEVEGARQEADEALSQAFADRDARERTEASASAAVRRLEREAAAAEAAKLAAIVASDEVVAATDKSAGSLGEAVEALHRWVDGVMVHGAPSNAASLEAVQASVRGAAVDAQSRHLRAAHASLESLQGRLQHVAEEVMRLRQANARQAADYERKEAELQAAAGRAAQLRKRCEHAEGAALQVEERARLAQQSAAEAARRADASEAREKEREAAEAEVRAMLEPRRRLVGAVAVQLSDALRRSGCVASDAPMLVDSSCHEWAWERVSLALSALSSHVCYYWAASLREAADAAAQLGVARERLLEKEESLVRAAAIAGGLKQVVTRVTAAPDAAGGGGGGLGGVGVLSSGHAAEDDVVAMRVGQQQRLDQHGRAASGAAKARNKAGAAKESGRLVAGRTYAG